MGRTPICLLGCLLAMPPMAHAGPEGRWQGTARIPGRDLRLVVDLSPDAAGVWAGSVILPGLGIKGAPLSNVVVTPTDVSFDTGSALASPPHAGAAFSAHMIDDTTMAGEMRQGGNVAVFSLAKVGPAQVEAPPRSTGVESGVEGRWTGEFELNGYPRHVTLTLENHGARGATAGLVVVGRQTTNVPVDLVMQEGENLRIESSRGMTFEGRFIAARDEISGAFAIGALELPLVLHRRSGGGS